MNEREHLSLAASVLLLPLVHFFTALFYRRQSTAVFFPVIGILPFVSRELQVGDRFVSDCAHHHPVSANRVFPALRRIARFCGDFRPLISQILVSVGVHASRGQFWVPCLRIQKFRSRGPASAARRLSYSGLSPSASNCRLHSVGGSRRRSMPMPRGSRPSTAALTRLGARKANEMAILTCRTLHFSRVQSCATVVTRSETTSSSHRRPRAIALTKRARRSNCSGRTSLRDALCGSRIWRDLLEGGLCQ